MRSRTLMERIKASLLATTLVAPQLLAEPLPDLSWRPLPPLPDAYGFAAPFSGVSHGDLLVIGGANFPDKPLSDGGKKVWHDRVFLLKPGSAQWEVVGTLPRPLGYGISITEGDGVICIGGSNSQEFSAKAFRLLCSDQGLKQEALPPLPEPLAMGAGALVGSKIYVAGGLKSPTDIGGTNGFFALDLEDLERGWQSLPTWPGPGRFQAVAGSYDGFFYLMSGLHQEPNGKGGHELVYLKDAYRYSSSTGWEKLPDLPHPAAAGASPAPSFEGSIFVIGGVDGANPGSKPKDFRLVPQRIQVYSAKSAIWQQTGNAPVGRVCVTAVEWQDGWVLATGEQSAGIRSPEVWSFNFANQPSGKK